MAKGYSTDLRARVVALVEAGEKKTSRCARKDDCSAFNSARAAANIRPILFGGVQCFF
jgi:hypothetical protein